MKLEQVEIVGMHNVDHKVYDLDQNLTYLCGPNGAGKSTVLQAVQLAILGYIPGYSKQKPAIIKHAKNRASMSVKVVFDDGSSIQRTYSTKKGSVSENIVKVPEDLEPSEFIGEIELPIFNFSQFLNLSSNEQKKWFLDFLPSRSKYDNWEDELKLECQSDASFDEQYFEDLMIEFKCLLNDYSKAIDGFKSVNSRVKEHISYERGNVSALQNTLNNLLRYSDEDIQNVSSSQLKSQISDLRKKRDLISSQASSRQELDVLKSRIEKYEKEYPFTVSENPQYEFYNKELVDSSKQQEELLNQESSYKDQLESLKARISDVSIQICDINDQIYSLKHKSNAIVTDDFEGVCPFTKEACESIKKVESDSKNRKKELEKQISELNSKLQELQSTQNYLNSQIAQIEQKLNSIPVQIQSLKMNDSLNNRRLEGLVLIYEDKVKLKKEYQELLQSYNGDPDSEGDSQDLLTQITSQIDKLQDDLVKVQANEKYDEMFEKVSLDMVSAKKHVGMLTIMEKYTGPNGIQNNISIQPFLNLQESLTSYLRQMFKSEDVSCWINLENKSNSFDFGIQRNGSIIGFNTLSSGEQCMYMLALLTCISQRSSNDFKFICVDDSFDNLDSDHIKYVSDFCKEVEDIQYLFAGVQKFTEHDIQIS